MQSATLVQVRRPARSMLRACPQVQRVRKPQRPLPVCSVPSVEVAALCAVSELKLSLEFVRSLPPIDQASLIPRLINLPQRKTHKYRKTLVLDLDETLVYLSNKDSSQPLRQRIQLRPFAQECLRQASTLFEVVVFTAGTREYVDTVVPLLDPAGEWIHHCLCRDQCILWHGVYVKDLRILNRSLNQVVIVDNEISSFAFQLANGVPILSWTGDVTDTQLLALTHYFPRIVDAEDVRVLNTATFGLLQLETECS